MGIEPGTSRFQIRQTLYRVAIKASSYSKAVLVLLILNPTTYTPSNCEILPRIFFCLDICRTSDTHGGFFTLGADVTQPEKSPTTIGIEPGNSRFQIRQTLYHVAIKASSYSKAV
ncbi:hypothetical protein DPMN_187295 [Dreissena polymorpha]|uniref:Uncharacterized protein n=1 Tax=Dreissena polymorpha TaxID=45954 RepID=A0A9D4DPW7_DREPO|nr:hypothetical protein DPMN_187295 [Dreissena polymorpha]